MKIGRDTGHTLALAALIVVLFGWLKADIDRIQDDLTATNDRLAAVEAGLRAELARTNERLAALEAGQVALEAGQAALEAGQAALEAGLAELRAALAATNERLARLEGAVAVALGRSFPPPPDGAEAPATD